MTVREIRERKTLDEISDMIFDIKHRLIMLEQMMENKFEIKDCLTLHEASEFTGYSESTIRGLMRENEITYYKNKGKVFIDREELKRVMRTGKVASNLELTRAAQKYCRTGKHAVLHKAIGITN